jgi:hypothetical protein
MNSGSGITNSTRHIGAAGELLVQYMLLKQGIDSSRMTTDAGIDLVAYSPKDKKAYTIQVKTKEKPTAAGGKGRGALGWFLRDDTPAELVALVDLGKDRVWLFTIIEFRKMAQQKSDKNVLHLYMYTESPKKNEHANSLDLDFEKFLLNNKINELFLT